MKASTAFPSTYLKSDDVSGEGETYTISDVTMETFKDQETQTVESKPVVWFKEVEKGLILNKTNWNRIAKVLNKQDSDEWVGSQIRLHLEGVEAFGRITDAIRVVLP